MRLRSKALIIGFSIQAVITVVLLYLYFVKSESLVAYSLSYLTFPGWLAVVPLIGGLHLRWYQYAFGIIVGFVVNGFLTAGLIYIVVRIHLRLNARASS